MHKKSEIVGEKPFQLYRGVCQVSESDWGAKASGRVGCFKKVSPNSHVPIANSLPAEYVLRREGAVLKDKQYFSRPVRRDMVGETEYVPRWITPFC